MKISQAMVLLAFLLAVFFPFASDGMVFVIVDGSQFAGQVKLLCSSPHYVSISIYCLDDFVVWHVMSKYS